MMARASEAIRKARDLRGSTRAGVFLTALAFALGLSAVASAEEVVKIVSSLPRTGSANAQTTSMVNGLLLAIEEAQGRVGEFRLVHEDWDDASPERGAWDPALEAANADRAIKDPDVLAYIGPYNSGAAKISMPKLNQAGLAMVNPANTWPGLTKPKVGEANEPRVYRPSGAVTYFRVVPADDIQGAVAAQWAQELGLRKVFVVHDRELYGKGIAEMFRQAAQKLGLQILGFEGIDPKAANYRSLAVKMRGTLPDLIYYGGTTQSNAGQLAKDIVSSGLQAKLMVPDGCFETAFIEAAGASNLENRVYITFGGVPPTQLTGKGREFYQRYRAKFGSEPEGYAVYTYEAAKVAITAIERAGRKDRRAVLAELAKIKDFQGALGTWSFDDNGDTTLRTMSGNTVKNGKFEFVKILGQ